MAISEIGVSFPDESFGKELRVLLGKDGSFILETVGETVGILVVGSFVGNDVDIIVGDPVEGSDVGDPLQREGSLNRFGSLILYNLPSEVPKYNSPFTSSPNVVTPPAVESFVVSESAIQVPLPSFTAPRINPFT